MKKNLILIGILIVLVGAFFLLNRSDKASQRAHIPDDLFAVDSASISKIEIHRPNDPDTVLLEKRGAEWYVTAPVDYPANQTNVENLLSRLGNLNIVTRISSNPENQSQFQVDSTGTAVKVYEANQMKLDFVVGKSSGGGMTYVRQSDSDDVYSLNTMLSANINRRAQDWRDRMIIEFDSENLQSVTLQQGTEVLTVTKSDEGEGIWNLTREGDPEMYYGNDTNIQRMVNSLRRFSTLRFVDNPDSAQIAKFAQPDSVVTVQLQDNTSWTLYFEPENEQATQFLVKRADKGDGTYYVTSKGNLSNILFSFDDLKGAPPAPPEAAGDSALVPPITLEPGVAPSGGNEPPTDE